MKKITNKQFKIKSILMEQDSNTNEIKLIKTGATITFAELLEPSIRQAPQGGFDSIDLQMLKDRIKATEVLQDLKVDEVFEMEDAVFNTIIKAGKEFRPGLASQALLDFKEYVLELEEMGKEMDKKAKEKKK